MTVFTREELRDITVAIDVLIGAYSEDFEGVLREQYKAGTEGGHRVRAILHKVYAVMSAAPVNDESAG